MTAIEKASPAASSPGGWELMKRQAAVLAKTELVPKALQGKPESIMLIGLWGLEHGVPFVTAVQDVHVIENRPSPSAQLRLALIRRAGHEVQFLETTPDKAVIRGRRREYRSDPGGWVTVEYTIDMARQAGLLDEWVEQWEDRHKQTWTIGDDQGRRDLTSAPEWVHKAIDAGKTRSKDNWRKYPADMLRARAASVLARMEFSDVMAGLGVTDHTPEELGLDVGQDLDEPVEEHPSDEDGDAEEVDDAVVVEDLARGPEPHPTRPTSVAPAPGEDTAADPQTPMPTLRPGDTAELAALKTRIRQGMTPAGWEKLIPWLEACKISPALDRLSTPRVEAIHAELDKRGVARPGHDHPNPDE